MNRKRNNFSGKEKISILKKYLVEKRAVSDLCDQHKIHPTVFYRWQKEFFEKGNVVFENGRGNPTLRYEKEISDLKAKLTRKNEVLSELMEEHVALKKSHGVT